jgi:lipopolysaccharide export system protein LptA
MRRLALLLPLVILAIAAALWGTYRLKKAKLKAAAPAMPPALTITLTSNADNWCWAQNKNGKPMVQICAKSARYLKEASKMELDAVELKLYLKDGQHYDLVKSPKAVFSQSEGKMFSDGEVEITINVPVTGTPPHQLTSIKTTGITFDSKSGQAQNDKPASFKFENGEGTCVGLFYDPDVHELHMNAQVDIHLTGKGKRSKPMHVQAERLVYQEFASKIFLGPWSKLMRDNTVVDAGGSVIALKDQEIDTIDADHAHGVDSYPKRNLNYAADALHVTYNEDGELDKMTGIGNAHLTSVSKGSATTVKANMVDLYFENDNNENVLRRTLANGNAYVEATPEPTPDGKKAETKIIHSENIELKMRKGGKELEQVASRVPTSLELVPNEPTQHHRMLHGAEMTILYGTQNQIQSLSSSKVTTDTDPLPPPPPKPGQKPKQQNLSVSHTVSDFMTAEFDPKTSHLKRMKQWGHFTYEEGERHSVGETAFLENDTNVMDIDKNARVSDASGSTNGDHIKLTQSTGDFDATGHVTTTRLPESKKPASSMLDDDAPSQGAGDHVWSGNKNRLVHYEGHAVLWQTSNRITADHIDIDRDKKILVAAGNVVSEFLDQDKDQDKDKDKDQKQPAAPPVTTRADSSQVASINAQAMVVAAKPETFAAIPAPVAATPAPAPKPDKPLIYTVVHAPKMVYTDATRIADYSGGAVELTRPNLRVKGEQIQAFLNPKDTDEDSRLNHMLADGKVEIWDKLVDRTRTSNGDHGEYYTADSRIVIRGVDAQMVDSKKGEITKAAELTYFSDDDKLLVKGAKPTEPVKSKLHRKQ